MQLSDAIWPPSQLGLLLESLSKAARLETTGASVSITDTALIDTACAHLGIEAETATLYGHEVGERIRHGAPLLVRCGDGFLAVIASKGAKAVLLRNDQSTMRVSWTDVEDELRAPAEAPFAAEIDGLLQSCGIASAKARRALLRERTRTATICQVWQLRTAPGASIARQLGESGLMSYAKILVAAHAVEYALLMLAWIVVGRGALDGRVDKGWMLAWILLLATIVPFRLLTTWSQNVLAIGCGGLLRQRLLAGALRLDAAEIRGEGAGRLLARTFEAETVEQLALSGGLTSVLAVIEAVFALYVLSQGAGGFEHAALFALFLGAVAWMARRLHEKRKRWTVLRLSMTHDLVERMTGHRTRLAQQPEENWHDGEDQAMDSYYEASRALDRECARLTGLLPRAWLLFGAAAMAPAFFAAQSDPAPLAVAIGGLLLGYRAMRSAVAGAASLAGAAIAWREVQPLFEAAARAERPGALALPALGENLIDARELFVRYDTRPKPVLDGVTLSVRRGDWILLEGASGGGKSTLASLIAGLREPAAGLLLAGGLDRATLGAAAWRRVVSAAPQYHENHVLTGTFAFNVLMGRAWPPSEADMNEARAVCDELALGPLLDRMPGGMEQMIGETGWQLSQGERSRLFMARALLQRSEIAILDESFAALDPENLRQAMECAQRRAKTLLVVAHP